MNVHDLFTAEEREAIRSRLSRPASERYEELVRRGAIDREGNVLIRSPLEAPPLNDIRRLQHAIIDAFPDAYTILSSPGKDEHEWFLDAHRQGRTIAAFWNRDGAFMVACGDSDYLECDGYRDALDRVMGFLRGPEQASE